MRRGGKPAKAGVKAKPPAARKSPPNEGSRVSNLEQSLTEALEQQAATAAILRVISSSPSDIQPVLDAVAASAARLCEAYDAAIFRVHGNTLHLVAHEGPIPGHAVGESRPLVRGSLTGRAVLDRRAIHVADVQAETDEYPEGSAVARRFGHRTLLAIPLLRAGEALGVITIRRTEVRQFSDRQVELLQTFANQAVIAIENVRLFNETKDALERETATSEILRVIASSPTNLQPVFDAILARATGLCEAHLGVLQLREGESYRAVAHRGASTEFERWLFAGARPLDAVTGVGRALREGQPIHIIDIADEPAYRERHPARVATVELGGARTFLAVPMVKEGRTIGAIVIYRSEVRPFTDTQIDLVQTFANQAVIAIENVRLFNETKEALEQQTATADILRVISSSPTAVQPVFDAIVQSGSRLCDAAFGAAFRFDGRMVTFTAHCDMTSDEVEVFRRQYPVPASRGRATGRAIVDRRVIHIPDIQQDPEYTSPTRQALGFRTVLAVPMLRAGEPIGALGLWRREVRPFTDKQIALLQTFADQAVIAIENVRLFTELEARNRELTEALDQQTATSEILRAISSSPTDLQPVFDTIVRSAVQLCGATFGGLHRFDGERVGLDAVFDTTEDGMSEEVALLRERVFPFPVHRKSVIGRALIDRRTVHVQDFHNDPEFDLPVVKELAHYRTVLAVPMLREGTPIGGVTLWRSQVHPFTEKEIGLVSTFAAQAVIAIENVRLFTELQAKNADLTEALEQQTATSEILRVISGSPTELQPVLDVVAENAARVCGASDAIIRLFEGDVLRLVAKYGPIPGEERLPLDRRSVIGRAVSDRQTIHVRDMQAELAEYPEGSTIARRFGHRTVLATPLLREGAPIGGIAIRRSDVQPFSDKQIALLQTFADQAVIAIENVRLFKELQARTAQLTRSVEELTALGDVGRTLSSTLDLDTVLQTIVTRASQLAGTDACSVYEYDEATEAFHLRATNNLDEEVVALARSTPTRKGEGVQGRMAVTRQPVQISDIAQEDAYRGPLRDILLRTGTRALLAIPMLREDQLIGGLTVSKKTPGEFPPEVIELLKTFATQSALAIQNARLFREIADKSRQLEAASRHKSEFLANMSHELRTPLNAIIGFSEVLAEGMFGEVNEKQAEYLRDILESGQHLLSLINDILDLSKIEAGRMELELTDFDLPQAISNALTLVRGRAERRSIALHEAVDQRLGQIRGDERKIKQVLLNLLSNALKFTPEGGRVEARASVVDGLAEIAVTDTGVGIAPEDQEAVFEEFRQVGTADKKVEGTGLGLTLSRKFIELHGGRIWVKSQVGVGSTFTFTLPLTT